MMTPSRVATAVKTVTEASLLADLARVQVRRLMTLALMLVVGSVTSVALAEGDAKAGGEKAYTCMGCHGVKHYVNTYPTYHVPKLAGQHQTYLVAALKAYRDGLRKHGTMQANAGPLTDQDIQDIAAFFANQKN